MKTDVHEHDDGYEVDIDLPGFKKEEIKLSLENGYLFVGAEKTLDQDQKNKKGKLIRQERYAGSMQRSFYVGDTLTEEDIKKFTHLYFVACGSAWHVGMQAKADFEDLCDLPVQADLASEFR